MLFVARPCAVSLSAFTSKRPTPYVPSPKPTDPLRASFCLLSSVSPSFIVLASFIYQGGTHSRVRSPSSGPCRVDKGGFDAGFGHCARIMREPLITAVQTAGARTSRARVRDEPGGHALRWPNRRFHFHSADAEPGASDYSRFRRCSRLHRT